MLVQSPAAGRWGRAAKTKSPLTTRFWTLRRKRSCTTIVYASLDAFTSVTNFLKPEYAAVFSSLIAAGSVGFNVYGGLLQEKKRVELQRELELERTLQAEQTELQGMIARYRGPLLESAIDLEQRLYHLITMTGEWYHAPEHIDYEDVGYTIYTMAQFLGFIEVVRREGPRERPFLQKGNPQGSDTLYTLMEGFKFLLCGDASSLQGWGGGELRDHPGARCKRTVVAPGLREPAGPLSTLEVPLRVSRGAQRAIGSLMIVTPMGAQRHYTMTYSDFCIKMKDMPEFSTWFRPLEKELLALLTGPKWAGQGPFPLNRWSRALLLQQLLVDTMDLLDPDYVRVPESRRIRLAPVLYAPLPNVEQYKATLSRLFSRVELTDPATTSQHFLALANLMESARDAARSSSDEEQEGDPARGKPSAPTQVLISSTSGGAQAPLRLLAGNGKLPPALPPPASQDERTAVPWDVETQAVQGPTPGQSHNNGHP